MASKASILGTEAFWVLIKGHRSFTGCGKAAATRGDFNGYTHFDHAQQVAKAASAFEQERSGHIPKSVTVVLSDNTLVVTLHGALSPAEKALAQSPDGAAKVQEFRRQLFTNSSQSLRDEIRRITGVAVREATSEVETATGTVVQVFTTGTMVQVFLLAHGITAETWNGNGNGKSPETHS